MRRLSLIIAACVLASACTWNDIEPPVDSRTPEGIEHARRVETERQNLCRMLDRDSARYERDCTRPGDPD